jgi:hypothetical protein
MALDGSDVANLVIPSFIAVAVAARGFRLDERRVVRWTDSAGLEPTDARRRHVRRYLSFSRRSRTVGGLIGFLAPTILARVVLDRPDVGGWSGGLLILGNLLGALVAELVANRLWDRTSGVERRHIRLGDHLSPYAAFLQRGLGVLAGALVLPYAILEPAARTNVPDASSAATAGVVGVGIAVAVEALQRRIVARPLAVDDDVALADAMRSSSVHVLAAVGIVPLLTIAGANLAALATLAGRVGEVVGIGLLMAGLVASFAVWFDLGMPRGFRVRRPEDQSVIR